MALADFEVLVTNWHPQSSFSVASGTLSFKFLTLALYAMGPYKRRKKVKWAWLIPSTHGLRTHNEGINQRYQKNWADVADKICFSRTYKFSAVQWLLFLLWASVVCDSDQKCQVDCGISNPGKTKIVIPFTKINVLDVNICTIWIENNS